MATHIVKAEVFMPNIKEYPDELLKIDSFKVEIQLKYMNGTVTCDTLEEVVELLRKIYKEEVARRQPKA